jgi:hypothetical protein
MVGTVNMSLGTLGSLASLLAAALYQGNHERSAKEISKNRL